ncbi:IucA/IucC family protein [Olivibacter domesticus]|uniref:Siderophore synthetase component n=1 Tax=Olivibacter domesticus TaxID=407022 RepID=A0A1H7MV25_OLID1|nr:IucA/IucC family siderophore biosynthesis protein [Olivibacter domesticus]SEL14457.1 Siderophore synthetase component [Olivibacter domesticus]
MKISYPISPQDAASHLSPTLWEKVNRQHLRKILAEFAHERIINPTLQTETNGWGQYQLTVPSNRQLTYLFNAKILALNHWYIAAESIQKVDQHGPLPLDSLRFIVEFNQEMGISQEMLPVYMEEVCSTLSGSAYTNHYGKASSPDLVNATYQQIEGTMTGHPRFIANNGRVGFDTADYKQFAPEAATPFALLWLAGSKQHAVYTGISNLSYQQVMSQELGKDLIEQFNKILTDRDLSPHNYFYFPVHPWQWFNKLANIFAPDIATGKLVCLGYSSDQYLPQQSIRTFYNISKPEKFYAKTALSILNMGYIRGLSPYFMRTNPGINEWIYDLIATDEYLQKTGFCILREVASVSYAHHYFETALTVDSPYKKMLACLWRESPASKIKEGQTLMTMAALLHVDNNGEAYLPQLINASGLTAHEWLKRYLHCYLSPLLHCFYTWDMVFMPHGENLILVLENHIPVRAIMKDIGEEVSLLNTELPIPEVAQRLKVQVTEENKTLPLFTQLFDSIFRFVAAILIEHADFQEDDFWQAVAQCILDYQTAHPAYATAYEKYDLFADSFHSDALNRMQLHNNKQLRNRNDPYNGRTNVGILINPISKFKNR